MFRGTFTTRLDEKGRLKMPADFKREIDRSYDAQFYLTSRNGAVVELYPLKEWEAVEQKLLSQPMSNRAVEKLLNVTSLYGQSLEMDGQGRLTIPEKHRNKFGLKGEVAVIGKMNRLEIQLDAEFTKSVESNLPTAEDFDELSRLGI
jgi:MraZ protein